MGSNAASYVGPCPTESLRRSYKEAKKQGLVTEPGKGAGSAGAAGAGATKPAPAEPAAIGSLVPAGPNGPWPGRLAPGFRSRDAEIRASPATHARAVRDGPRGACEPVQWLAANDGACALDRAIEPEHG